jgi:hypothetical protein
VPEYDAFGREIGENTLAGLGGDSNARRAERADDGWSESQLAEARAEPVTAEAPAAEPVMPEPPRSEPPEPRVPDAPPVVVVQPRRRMGGLGCLVGVVILFAITSGPVIGLVGFFDSAKDTIEDVTGALDDVPLPDELLAPTGIGGNSLIARSNFAGSLEQVRDAGYGRASEIDLRPDRLTVSTVKNGELRDVKIGWDGGFESGEPAASSLPTFALKAVDPAAPARLVRASARRFDVRPKRINYLLAGPEPGGGHHWRAYFKNGTYVEGDAAGRIIRRFDGG